MRFRVSKGQGGQQQSVQTACNALSQRVRLFPIHPDGQVAPVLLNRAHWQDRHIGLGSFDLRKP